MKISHKYIQSYTHNGCIGVLVEFGLQSSMPLRNQSFTELMNDIAMQIASTNPENIEQLLNQKFVKDSSINIGELISRISEDISEKFKITRFIRWNTEPVLPETTEPDEPPPKLPAQALRLIK